MKRSLNFQNYQMRKQAEKPTAFYKFSISNGKICKRRPRAQKCCQESFHRLLLGLNPTVIWNRRHVPD